MANFPSEKGLFGFLLRSLHFVSNRLSQAFKSSESFQSNPYINALANVVSLPINDLSPDHSNDSSISANSGESNRSILIPSIEGSERFVQTGSVAHFPSTPVSHSGLHQIGCTSVGGNSFDFQLS